MLMDVIKMGNPILRERSVEVSMDDLATVKKQTFIDNLIATMQDENGAGIAAPQVGVLDRIFIIECVDNPRYPDQVEFPLTVAINPVITAIGEEQIDSWEGCLSIPNIRGRLPRYTTVLLEAYDQEGVFYSKELSGFEAIVAQHELDHLDGILFVDRMPSMEYLSFHEEYLEYWM